MKLIASLVLWISLGLGAIAGTTAYRPTLDAVAAAPTPLTLGAPAGRTASESGTEIVPLVRPTQPDGTPTLLDQATIATLRAGGVERVKVKEFSLLRWKEAWLFAIACVGLVTAAALLRLDARRIATTGASAAGSEAAPEAALARAADELTALRESLRATDAVEAMPRLVDGLNRIQATHLTAFLDARPRLLSRMGMGRFARLMGSFATAERQLHRAWSAAADRVPDEALDCLERGTAMLRATIDELAAVSQGSGR